jgi:purine-binding chemotaxis protein CheW
MNTSISAPGTSSPSISADDKSNQYLTFLLGDEQYGVDILRVQEIRGWERAIPIPNTPDYVRGVINLRGSVIPIIELRRLFHKVPAPDSPTAVVVVVKVFAQDTEKTVGMLVDAVSDVRNAGAGDIKSAPDMEMGDAGFVTGLITLDQDMIILLDIDRLLDNPADQVAA